MSRMDSGPPRRAPETVEPRDGAAPQRDQESLRQQILRGDLVPGQRLVEGEIGEQSSVTRAGVRAGLFDLTADGLVERVQHRGARVRVVGLEEAIEIAECRMVLEGLCAAKAAERLTSAEHSELEGLGRSMREAVSRGDLLAYSELNHTLHRRIREISGQSTAERTIERLRGQLVRHQFRFAPRPGRPSASLPEHEAIIAAVTQRDPSAAEQATRQHLLSVIEALRAAGESRHRAL